MEKVKFPLTVTVAAAALLGVGLTNARTTNVQASTSEFPNKLLRENNVNNNHVVNGFSDNGYTFINPDSTSSERVSSYHLDNTQGWSNDLQTIIYDTTNKEWDIYYLHTEKVVNGNTGAKQNWERVTTKDFIHFSKPNTAIKDLTGDIGDSWSSAWTGSIITNRGNIPGVPKGAKVAYFSGLSNKDNQQNIWAAWSDDNGKTFSHPLNDKKPVIDHSWSWASVNHSDERDSGVFYWKGKMIMYTAEGDNLGVYQSKDGIKWTPANQEQSKIPSSVFFKGLPFGAPVECPAVRSMKTASGAVKQVLFFGAMAPQAGQTKGTYYIVGHLDDNGIFTPETDVKRLDQGTDYYGANVNGSDDLDQADQSLITMGWAGNWNYTNSGIKPSQDGSQTNSTRLGAYTLARKLVLNNDLTLSNTPMTNGLEEKASNNVKGNVSDKKISSEKYHELLNLKKEPANSKYELHFSTKKDQKYQGSIKITFTQGKDQNTIIFDPTTGKYRVDGESSELSGDAAAYYKNGLEKDGSGYLNDSGLKDKNDFTITLFTDKNSIELFFSNGQAATMARFCVNNIQDVKVEAQDENKANQFDINYSQVGTKLAGFEDNNKPANTPAVNKAKKGHSKKVLRTAYVYNKKGRKTGRKLKQGSVIKTYGIKKIKGKKFYVLSKKRYVLVEDISGKKRKLRYNAFVFNKNGKRIKKMILKRKSKVRTYGSAVKIKGKMFYVIGKNRFVKKANF